MFASIVAALAALPEIVKILGEVVSELKNLRQSSIDSSLDKIKADVNETLTKIQSAKSNEERSVLARDLNARLGK